MFLRNLWRGMAICSFLFGSNLCAISGETIPSLIGAGVDADCAPFAAAVSRTSGNFSSRDSFGCAGAFQFCPGTLIQYFQGSVDEFLASPSAQVAAWKAYLKTQWQLAKYNGVTNLIGQSLSFQERSIIIDQSAILMACEFFGCGASSKLAHYVRGRDCNATDVKDGNGTSVCQYLVKGAGLNVSCFVGESAAQFVKSTTVPFTADRIKFLHDQSYLLLSQADGKLERRLIGDDRTVWSALLSHPVSDLAVSKDGNYVYLVGNTGVDSIHDSVVSRVDVNNGRVVEAKLDVGGGVPSIAAGSNQKLYFGTTDSAQITFAPSTSFDELGHERVVRTLPSHLLVHGVSGLSTPASGSILFATDAQGRTIAAFDVDADSLIDYFGFEQSLSKFRLKTSVADFSTGKAVEQKAFQGTRAGIIVGAFGPVSRLVVAEVEEAFGAFGIIQSVEVSFPDQTLTNASRFIDSMKDSPLILVSDIDQRTIVVGSKLSRYIFVYSKDGRTITLRGSRVAKSLPQDIAVSADGSVVATLMSGGKEVELSRPDSADYSFELGAPSLIGKAQRRLSELGFPVGSVDGIPGPQTTQAILLFQKRHNLPATGSMDTATQDALGLRDDSRTNSH